MKLVEFLIAQDWTLLPSFSCCCRLDTSFDEDFGIQKSLEENINKQIELTKEHLHLSNCIRRKLGIEQVSSLSIDYMSISSFNGLLCEFDDVDSNNFEDSEKKRSFKLVLTKSNGLWLIYKGHAFMISQDKILKIKIRPLKREKCKTDADDDLCEGGTEATSLVFVFRRVCLEFVCRGTKQEVVTEFFEDVKHVLGNFSIEGFRRRRRHNLEDALISVSRSNDLLAHLEKLDLPIASEVLIYCQFLKKSCSSRIGKTNDRNSNPEATLCASFFAD